MTIMFRASSERLSAAQIEAMLPGFDVHRSWEKGDLERKRVLEESGLSSCLSELDDTKQAVLDAVKVLEASAGALRKLADEEVHVEIDIPLFVTATQMRTVAIPMALSAIAASCNIVICVSAYPCADK
ncbi:MAG: hypothetical protein ABW352_13030 [Polyangiales bacterium]